MNDEGIPKILKAMDMSVEALERRFEVLRDEVSQYNVHRQKVIEHVVARRLPEGVVDLCEFRKTHGR